MFYLFFFISSLCLTSHSQVFASDTNQEKPNLKHIWGGMLANIPFYAGENALRVDPADTIQYPFLYTRDVAPRLWGEGPGGEKDKENTPR